MQNKYHKSFKLKNYCHKLIIKLYSPSGKLAKQISKLAGNGYFITENGIDNILTEFADKLERDLPQLEYKVVEIKSAKHIRQFNFVYVGERPDVETLSVQYENQINEQVKKEQNQNGDNSTTSCSS